MASIIIEFVVELVKMYFILRVSFCQTAVFGYKKQKINTCNVSSLVI